MRRVVFQKIRFFQMFLRSFFLQSLWNFERGLNYGFALALLPVLRAVYQEEERREALMRHMSYFSTHPYLASLVIGAVARLEEERSKETTERGKMRKEEEINALKIGLMGPLAALGDNFFWAVFRPFCVFLAVFAACAEVFPTARWAGLGAAFFLLFYNIFHLFIRARMLRRGFLHGDQAVLELQRYRFQENISILKTLLAGILGVFAVLWNSSVVANGTALFLLKLVFFIAILGLYAFAVRKRIPSEYLVGAIVLFAMVLVYWPKLSAAPPIGSPTGG